MAYSSIDTANRILELKNDWDKAQNQTQKNSIAQKAQTYYNQLRENGDTAVANSLQSKNAAQAGQYIDKYYKTQGKTQIRPYYYNLGKKYGMSQSDVDKAISYDDVTGEVSLGGKNIGSPYSVVNGTSYWDSDKLDKEWNDYAQRAGLSRSKENMTDTLNEQWYTDYKDAWGMNKKDSDALLEELKQNPYATDWGKSIMDGYNYSGMKAAYNAAAKGAANNGGNIDSFSAANAMRQQAALNQLGKQDVLNFYTQRNNMLANETSNKLNRALNMLNSLSGQSQMVFEQDQTAKNNDVSRNATIAGITGYIPTEWTLQNDPMLRNYVDENGNLKQEYYNTDFQALINNAKAKGDNTLANKYAILRGLKFAAVPESRKYMNEGDVAYAKNEQILSAREGDKDRESAYNLAKMGYENNIDQINAQAQAKADQSKIDTENTIKINDAISKNNIDEDNAKTDNLLKASTYSEPRISATEASQAIKSGDTSQEVIDAYNYWYNTNHTTENPPFGAAGKQSISSDLQTTMGSSDSVSKYINEILIPIAKEFDTVGEKPDVNSLKEQLLQDAEKYDLKTEDLTKICNAFGVDNQWVSSYKNKFWGKGVKEA